MAQNIHFQRWPLRRRLWLLFAFFLSIVVGWKVAHDMATRKSETEIAHFKAWAGETPPFQLDSFNGIKVDLHAYKGKRPVLVYFFATWHEESVMHWQGLLAFARNNQDSLAVVAVTLDESPRRIEKFLDGESAVFPIVLDHKRRVADSWDVNTLPTTFVLDKALNPRLIAVEPLDWEAVKAQALLAKLKLS